MCVVSIAWQAHPRWLLLVAGNRDEFHARASAPLARWIDRPDLIAGRDLQAGGTWLGVNPAGRFAVITNVRTEDGPRTDRRSRGDLVSGFLAGSSDFGALEDYNPFSLITVSNDGAHLVSNRPLPQKSVLLPGIHGISNGVPGDDWPRKSCLDAVMQRWVDADAHEPKHLFTALCDEADIVGDQTASPIFIRDPEYGTRCSTVVAVDTKGRGFIIERHFGPNGIAAGQTQINFEWPIH